MKKIDPSVIITSLISGIFGLISTTLTVILPRLLDRPKPLATVVQVPLPDMIPSSPRDMIPSPDLTPRDIIPPLPVPRRAPSSIIIEEVPLISFTDILYIVIATAFIILIAVMIMKKIKNRRKNED